MQPVFVFPKISDGVNIEIWSVAFMERMTVVWYVCEFVISNTLYVHIRPWITLSANIFKQVDITRVNSSD